MLMMRIWQEPRNTPRISPGWIYSEVFNSHGLDVHNLWGRGFLSWICLRWLFYLIPWYITLVLHHLREHVVCFFQASNKQIQAYEVPQLPITNWDEYWSHLQFSLCLFLLKATCIGICRKISVKWKKEGALAYWRMDIFQLFLLLIGRLWLKPALEAISAKLSVSSTWQRPWTAWVVLVWISMVSSHGQEKNLGLGGSG